MKVVTETMVPSIAVAVVVRRNNVRAPCSTSTPAKLQHATNKNWSSEVAAVGAKAIANVTGVVVLVNHHASRGV